jgi:hypothetical protein
MPSTLTLMSSGDDREVDHASVVVVPGARPVTDAERSRDDDDVIGDRRIEPDVELPDVMVVARIAEAVSDEASRGRQNGTREDDGLRDRSRAAAAERRAEVGRC